MKSKWVRLPTGFGRCFHPSMARGWISSLTPWRGCRQLPCRLRATGGCPVSNRETHAQHSPPTAGAGVGNALLRNTAELLTWRHCPATTTSASAIRRCCAALTRGSLFFLLVFLLVLLRFIANIHRRIQFPPGNESPSSLAFFFALSLPGLALRFTRKSHQIHTGLISASCAVRR